MRNSDEVPDAADDLPCGSRLFGGFGLPFQGECFPVAPVRGRCPRLRLAQPFGLNA